MTPHAHDVRIIENGRTFPASVMSHGARLARLRDAFAHGHIDIDELERRTEAVLASDEPYWGDIYGNPVEP